MSLRKAQATGLFVALFIALVLALLWLPEWMVNQYHGKPLSRSEYTNAVDEYRKTLAQIIGGCALLIGLYFTWRTTKAAEDGRITDRFSRAVEQLGATNKDGSKQIEPRLGGIYSLERIARDSKRDARGIVEIFCAYVRENAPRRFARTDPTTGDPLEDPPEIVKIATDIQAILTIISKLRPLVSSDPSFVPDLNSTELFMADLAECQLGSVDLRKAYLERADVSRGYLETADLTNAYLFRAKLTKANLRNARLYRADLRSADLYGADLQGANLSEANLSKADLKKAVMGLIGNNSTNLRGTALREANLIGVDLSYVSGLGAKQIAAAVIDETTILPQAVIKEMQSFGMSIPPRSSTE